jgi:hypothetical protein
MSEVPSLGTPRSGGDTGPVVSIEQVEPPPPEAVPEGPILRNSIFFITINSQLAPKSNTESAEMTAALNSVINRMFEQPKPLLKMLEGDYDADVKRIEMRYSIELGPEGRIGHVRPAGRRGKGGRIHAHILLDITHAAKIHLDYGYIRRAVRFQLGQEGFAVPNIYLDVQVQRGSRQAMINYLMKDGRSARLVEALGAGAAGA